MRSRSSTTAFRAWPTDWRCASSATSATRRMPCRRHSSRSGGAPASFRAERAKASTWILTLVHRRAVDLVRREERRAGRAAHGETRELVQATEGARGGGVAALRVADALRMGPERLPTRREALGGASRQLLRSLSSSAERLGVQLGTIKEGRMFVRLTRAPERHSGGDYEHRKRMPLEAEFAGWTGGYALDALESGRERHDYEAQSGEIKPACKHELACGYWTATGALAVAASGPAPSRRCAGASWGTSAPSGLWQNVGGFRAAASAPSHHARCRRPRQLQPWCAAQSACVSGVGMRAPRLDRLVRPHARQAAAQLSVETSPGAGASAAPAAGHG